MVCHHDEKPGLHATVRYKGQPLICLHEILTKMEWVIYIDNIYQFGKLYRESKFETFKFENLEIFES